MQHSPSWEASSHSPDQEKFQLYMGKKGSLQLP